MIEDAERRGIIQAGKTVLIEGTSGNMGIALAWTAAVKGYKLVLVMPSTMSLERRTLLKAYGAEFVLTDPEKGFAGVLDRVHALAELIPNSHVLNQVKLSLYLILFLSFRIQQISQFISLQVDLKFGHKPKEKLIFVYLE